VQLTLFQPLLWLGLLIVVLMIGYCTTLVDRLRAKRLASFICRVLAVALLTLALCRPITFSESEGLHALFLVDVSESIDLKAVHEAANEISQAIQMLGSQDSYTLAALGNGVRLFKTPEELITRIESWQNGIADDTFRNATRRDCMKLC
jgi:Ca-activated chloride channel family protein